MARSVEKSSGFACSCARMSELTVTGLWKEVDGRAANGDICVGGGCGTDGDTGWRKGW